jgi:hypothetical protein
MQQSNKSRRIPLLTNQSQDCSREEGPCEIQPVEARHLFVGPRPAPAARGSDLNYNQREKERRLMEAEQKLTAVSWGRFNHNQVNRYSNCSAPGNPKNRENCLF